MGKGEKGKRGNVEKWKKRKYLLNIMEKGQNKSKKFVNVVIFAP